MSEKKLNSNNDNPKIDKNSKDTQADAELEELISSVIAMKKMQAENKKKEESEAKSNSPSPDISFTPKAVPASAEATTPKPNSNSSKPVEKKKSVSTTGAKKTTASNSAKSGNVKKKASASAGGTAVKKSAGGANSAKKKTASAKPQAQKATDKQAENAVAVGATEAENGKKKTRQKWSKKKTVGVILGVLFLVLCILAGIIWLIFHNYFSLLGGKWNGETTDERPTYSDIDTSRDDTIDGETEDEKLKAQLEKSATNIMSDSDVFNILLIGEDLRDTAGESRGNTDVMMLISINQKMKTITMTSFMRDIYVYISDWGYSNRLNAAYYHGGPDSLEDTIEQYFGITIDRYAIVNFNQFITIVDTLGGLELDVTQAEVDAMVDPQNEQNMYLGQDFGTDILTEGGEGLLLNGNQALAFARIRKGVGDDFARTERQRTVIATMIETAKKMSLVQLNELVYQVFPNVYTDIEEGEAASMLLNAFDYMKYDIQQLQVPADGLYTNEVIDGMDVLCPDFDANAKLIQETVYGETIISDDSDEYDDDDDYGNGNTYGYYDQWGNWIAYNNGYYDKWGNWVSY